MKKPFGLGHVSNTFNCCGVWVNVYILTIVSRITTILKFVNLFYIKKI